MCMIFNRKNKPHYIRLCCRTGRAGVHVNPSDYIYRCISPETLAAAIAKSRKA